LRPQIVGLKNAWQLIMKNLYARYNGTPYS